MQLRTILISTGLLAFATSFALGGPTPAIHATGPCTNVNRGDNVIPVAVIMAWNDFSVPLNFGDWIALNRLERMDTGPVINDITVSILLFCDTPNLFVPGNITVSYNPNFNKLEALHRNYLCGFNMDAKGEHHGLYFPPALAYAIWCIEILF
ncbi:hypothetical protein BC827DRAFT_1159004 [Russula dissimulans]|nr:hypothetical protein BC827DRAFT_1159004 [Russula dissimulans]